jgi:hypothetical protein
VRSLHSRRHVFPAVGTHRVPVLALHSLAAWTLEACEFLHLPARDLRPVDRSANAVTD